MFTPIGRCGFAAVCVSLLLLGLGPSLEAAETGVFVNVRESDAPDARVVERWKLYGSSHALVIGIDDYTGGWPKLKNAVKDARIVADELKRQGFNVDFQTNLNEADLRKVLRTFYAVKGSDPEARLLLWYAGHGHTVRGEGFIVPADAPLPSYSGFKLKALHMRDFAGLMRLAGSKHVLSIFDSCFSGTIFDARAGARLANVTHKTANLVRQFVTAGDAGQAVRDDGSFRELFVRAIRGDDKADANDDGFVTGEELGLFLSQRMTSLTNAAQTPRYGKLQDVRFDQGDFVFVLPKETTSRLRPAQNGLPAGSPTNSNEAALELAFWREIKDSGDPAQFQAYLESFPDGRFASLARVRAEPPEVARPAPTENQQQAALPPSEEPPIDLDVEDLDETFVAVKRSNVRAGPSSDFEKVDLLEVGERIAVTGEVVAKPWYRVALTNGDKGFVYAPLVETLDSYRTRLENEKRQQEKQARLQAEPRKHDEGQTHRLESVAGNERYAHLFPNRKLSFNMPCSTVWSAVHRVLDDHDEDIKVAKQNPGTIVTRVTRHGIVGFPSYRQYLIVFNAPSDGECDVNFKLLLYDRDYDHKSGSLKLDSDYWGDFGSIIHVHPDTDPSYVKRRYDKFTSALYEELDG